MLFDLRLAMPLTGLRDASLVCLPGLALRLTITPPYAGDFRGGHA